MMISEGNYNGGNAARRVEACSGQARGGFEMLREYRRTPSKSGFIIFVLFDVQLICDI